MKRRLLLLTLMFILAAAVSAYRCEPEPLLPLPALTALALPSAAQGGLTFALTNSANPSLSSLLDHNDIDGVALQEGWGNLETQNDIYNWTLLDAAIAQAQTKGKRVSLHIMASPRTPNWLAGAGASYYTATDFQGNIITDVVPWDRVYLSEYTEFLQVLSQHIQVKNYTPVLFDVSLVVPVAEMDLVACRNGHLGNSLVYNRSVYLDAWKQMIDAYHTAFPTTTKFVSPAVNDLICAPEQDASFYRELMDYALTTYDNSFWMFAADLNAEGSQRTQNYLDYVTQTSLGYQTIWSATDDSTNRMEGTYPTNLKDAICQGLSNGAIYFEIYAVDVLNPEPAIQAAIQIIHNPSQCGVFQLYLPFVFQTL